MTDRTSSGRHADVIVLGLGGWGSAVAYHAARRGLRTLGFDQHEVPHGHGSSHGRTRGYRLAAPEDKDYFPLNLRAGELYDALSSEYGTPLLVRPGGAFVGPSGYFYTDANRLSLEDNGLPFELYEGRDAARKFPQFPLQSGESLLFDPSVGIMFPEEIVDAHLSGASRAGADLHMSERIEDWAASAGHVEVSTPRGTYRAERLVIAAGPWAPALLGAQVPIEVERQVVAWLSPKGTPFANSAEWPIWGMPWEGCAAFYGFPDVHGDGIKVALHHGGEVGSFSSLNRSVTDDDIQRLQTAIAARLPSLAAAPITKALTCWYTNSPDRLHLIGAHPDHDRVLIATGESGRGFKLAPVVGELVADLLQGESTPQHAMVSLSRMSGSAS